MRKKDLKEERQAERAVDTCDVRAGERKRTSQERMGNEGGQSGENESKIKW